MDADARVITADQIITMDPRRPRADAVAVAGGRITAVGTIAECLGVADVPVTDLARSTLMPGFVEPHSHPLLSGITTEAPAYNVSPWLVADWQGIVAVARKAIAEVAQGNSILMFGLDQLLHGCPFPTAAEMDDLFGDRIAVIVALSQHKAAVTSATLRALGWLDSAPPDPVGGTFGRRNDGSLDGTAHEVPAVLVFSAPALQSLGGNPLAQAASYLAGMSRRGITTAAELAYDSTMASAYAALWSLPHVPMRMSVYHSTADPSCSEAMTAKVAPELLRKGGLKFWADGSPWLGTIASSFPYLEGDAVRRAGITDLHPGPKAFNYNRDELDAMLAQHGGQGWRSPATPTATSRSTWSWTPMRPPFGNTTCSGPIIAGAWSTWARPGLISCTGCPGWEWCQRSGCSR